VTDLSRRQMLGALAALPLAAALDTTPAAAERAIVRARRAAQHRPHGAPEFFTPHEFETVRGLADLVIPRDDRSGSASDAGVPEFIDFTVNDRESLQVPIRGGLAWLDAESRKRFDRAFVDVAPRQRRAILDDIAWPDRAPESLAHGVAFFTRFRDLAASGFYTSRIGMEDLRFMGNRPNPFWNGCPPEALRSLGVRYGDS
jgi:gluconate 2-dehydrogenase gamma chain